MKLNDIYIAAEGGNLYYLNDNELDKIFTDDKEETLMGLSINNNFLYVSSKSRIFKFKKTNNSFKKIKETKHYYIRKFATLFRKRWVQFHQMNIINNLLYVTVTHFNEIWIFNKNLKLKETIKIKPPIKYLPIFFKYNYNHINSIFKYKNNFFLSIKNYYNNEYKEGGYIVLDKNFNELKRFPYGWESHNLVIYENKKICLCANIKDKAKYSKKSGLLIDGKLVFKHSDNFFCKDFSIDNNYIYIVGGEVKNRSERKKANGIIYIISKKTYELLYKQEFKNTGGFTGIILSNNNDFSKN